VIGNLDDPSAADTGIKSATEPQYTETYTNNTVEGFNDGYFLWPWGNQTISGGYVSSVHGIMIGINFTRLQTYTATITGVTFDPNNQVNIGLDGDFSQLTAAEFPALFAVTNIQVNDGSYQGQLYFADQAASFVPFPSGSSPSFVPAALIGLTNAQLWATYGIAVGGAVAPSTAVTASGIKGGLMGPITIYPPTITMLSDPTTKVLTGYQLVYLDIYGNRVVDPNLINLVSGWNLITLTVDGVLHTFFVYGGTL
jgi:hypothetical protein